MNMEYLRNVVSLRLEAEACIGCGRCVEVCPHGVFGMADEKSVIADRDACMECGACALNCPVDALKVNSGVGCAEGLLNAALGCSGACCGEKETCCCGGSESETKESQGSGCCGTTDGKAGGV